jgi:ornithine cyclodeaminase
VHAALPWPRLANALAQAFAEGAEVPVRHAHALGGGDTLLLMPAWTAHSLGTKLVTVMPGNAARGVGTVQALYLLFDRSTGEPRALLDGEALTVRRTAAASALAARYLARDDARTLLVVGAGRLAPWMARAHTALRPGLERVLLWARDAAARDARAAALRSEGLPVQAVDDLEAAVREADIVCCATTSTTPLVKGVWLRPGAHVDLVGGFRPDMREVDDDAVARSRVVVDTLAGALAEAGDLLQPLQRGVIAREHVLGELADLARGTLRGRDSSDDVTLFKSVGTALEDLAAAELVVG